MFSKLIKTEESMNLLFWLAGLILLLISFGLAGLDWFVVAGLSVFMILLVGVNYLTTRKKWGKYRIDNRPDERTGRMTQMASRNGYLAALLGIAALALLSSAGYIKFGAEALMWLYVAVVFVQSISYAYYVDRGLA